MRLFGVIMGSKRISVTAVRHALRGVPMKLALDNSWKNVSSLKDLLTGAIIPAQTAEGNGQRFLYWIMDELPKSETREFEPTDAVPEGHEVELMAGESNIGFLMNGELFTAYHFGPDVARPYLYPVIGPGGMCMTRQYPMIPDIPGETKDHVHHKSIWVAHGDVNGVDDWSEEKGHGRIVHRSALEQTSGPVFGRLKTLNDWVSSDGRKVMEEERTITVYNLPETGRFIDISVIFRATEGEVKFGDTKEGGIISVRVATSMDGDKGGLITNSFGGITESESWGKRAHWCDYSGPVEGRTVGITVFDTPGNFRYPSYWHVRNYGLMTANPFALSEYFGDKSRDGSHIVEAGSTFPFSYRIFIHDGDARSANVIERYHGYINPPAVEVR